MTARTLQYLVRAEFLKLSSTRTALGLLIAALLVSVLPAILLMSLVPRDALDNGDAAMAATGLTIVPILAVVFGILGMTNEYRHGTITYTYLTTPRRGVVIVVKLLCYAVVGTAVMALAGFLVIIAIEIVANIRDIALPFLEASQATDAGSLRDVALLLLTVGLMTAFGVSLGALFRAQVPTVAGVVIWSLAIESIVVAVKPHIGIYLPFTVFQQLNLSGEVGSEGTAADVMLSRPEAFALSLAYIAAFSVAAVFTSMRRDVT